MKVYGVYFAFSKYEVGDECNPHEYPREFGRAAIYKSCTDALEAYANTRCPASQFIEADSTEDFLRQVQTMQDNFENPAWLDINIHPYC